MDVEFCLAALDEALEQGVPEIFNTDQGVQFTSRAYTERLFARGIEISMDGRGRALDNVFIERLWRSLNYEDIYLKGYDSGADCHKGLIDYFKFYCHECLISPWTTALRGKSTPAAPDPDRSTLAIAPAGPKTRVHFTNSK